MPAPIRPGGRGRGPPLTNYNPDLLLLLAFLSCDQNLSTIVTAMFNQENVANVRHAAIT